MRLNRNFQWLAMLTAVAVCSAGCGGINAGTTVSPATFLLPGLMKADPPVATNAPVALSGLSNQLAQAR